jgi:hypothetical protein
MRSLWLVLLIPACASRAVPGAGVDLGTTKPGSACVSGRYEWACYTDCPGGADPRCPALPDLVPATGCDFPGVKCEYAAATIACDCDRVAHCLGGECPASLDLPCGGLTCGADQGCAHVATTGWPPPDMAPDPTPKCFDGIVECHDCRDCPTDPCAALGARCGEVNPVARTLECVFP